ncbi:hypothetical protein [Gordonia phthalatica]|nr:hypothetical protein [Gordonia phthalatica]
MDEHVGETSIAPGTPSSPDDIDDAIRLELEFLTSLIWAPDAMTTATVTAIVGAPADRPRSDDHLPVASGLFLRPIHDTLFTAITARVDDGLPVTPTLLSEGIDDPRARTALRGVILEIAAPSGPGPLPGGADVPHLAAALIDRWYRRGYAGLLARMGLVAEESATADLAEHWAAMTAHQQRAHRRWAAIRTRLADL